MQSKFALPLLVVFCFYRTQGQDYCSQCAEHTMCIYNEVGAACEPLATSGTQGQEDVIVDAHNDLRRKVAKGEQTPQPSASNMRRLVWDAELAEVAQRWANQCTFGHDQCRSVDRFSVGQNVYMLSTTDSAAEPDWRSAVTAWYDEVKDFDPNHISPFQFSAETGHYTQVVWAETTNVGCGFAKFQQSVDPSWHHLYYVCNYGRAGNIIDGTMYELGVACSQCPAGTSCDNSLCA